jgi:hypothetical protein
MNPSGQTAYPETAAHEIPTEAKELLNGQKHTVGSVANGLSN